MNDLDVGDKVVYLEEAWFSAILLPPIEDNKYEIVKKYFKDQYSPTQLELDMFNMLHSTQFKKGDFTK